MTLFSPVQEISHVVCISIFTVVPAKGDTERGGKRRVYAVQLKISRSRIKIEHSTTQTFNLNWPTHLLNIKYDMRYLARHIFLLLYKCETKKRDEIHLKAQTKMMFWVVLYSYTPDLMLNASVTYDAKRYKNSWEWIIHDIFTLKYTFVSVGNNGMHMTEVNHYARSVDLLD